VEGHAEVLTASRRMANLDMGREPHKEDTRPLSSSLIQAWVIRGFRMEFFFFLAVLGFELRASCLLDRRSTSPPDNGILFLPFLYVLFAVLGVGFRASAC
jgi:hypothetical protein